MEAGLTADSFSLLLTRLDADRDQAGEKYEDLRRTLTRFFEWRGAPFPEEHADETLNRVAQKLSKAVEIRNVGSYSYEVARLIFLETLKRPDSKRTSLETLQPQPSISEPLNEVEEKEKRMECLDTCLEALPKENRLMILAYYDDEGRDRIGKRQALATRLGLQREALANRMQRLRDKLEQCVVGCLKRK